MGLPVSSRGRVPWRDQALACSSGQLCLPGATPQPQGDPADQRQANSKKPKTVWMGLFWLSDGLCLKHL